MENDFYARLDARVRDRANSERGLRSELDSTRGTRPDRARPTYEQTFGPPMPDAGG